MGAGSVAGGGASLRAIAVGWSARGGLAAGAGAWRASATATGALGVGTSAGIGAAATAGAPTGLTMISLPCATMSVSISLP